MDSRVYQSSWSVDPMSWNAVPSEAPEDPVTLEPPSRDAALQFSTYQKRSGNVTEEDIRSFASDRGLLDAACVVVCGSFTGLMAANLQETSWWRYWWLRAEGIHLFVTYNGNISISARDHLPADEILQTLRLEAI